MELVRLENILSQSQPVNNRQHRVGAINRKQQNKDVIMRNHHKFQNKINHGKPNCQTSNVARETNRFNSEIEKAEHNHRKDHRHKQVIIHKANDTIIYVKETSKNNQAVTRCYTVNPVHEIVGVYSARRYYQQE
jgi:hypothetical protein